ncbi:MAG: hypothetical protein KBD01_16255 [Acidobacteria bacterium]|nr:hypothetical protein [Acidobacteriota bacterium]
MRFAPIAAAGLACAVAIAAAPPALLNYQGVLRGSTDAPLSGNFDMTFRFYSAASAGDEILVDRHTAASGGPVAVSGGLFNTTLGAGAVSDGAGPGTYGSLADVFRDYGTVYLSVQVGAETLAPRTQIVAAAYAQNAAVAQNALNLAGKSGGAYLDTSPTPQTKSGPATFDASALAGGYGVRTFGPDGGLYAGDATGAGHTELGKDDFGLRAFGSWPGGMAGYFKDTANSGEAYVADGDFGILGYGGSGGAGGLFRHGTPTSYDSEVSVADSVYGVKARGAGVGGSFEPTNFSSHAYAGLDGGGVYATGNSYGGYFADSSGGATAYLGYGYIDGGFRYETGIRTSGTHYGVVAGSDSGVGVGVVGSGQIGGWFYSTTVGAVGAANLGNEDSGINAQGTYTGSEFNDAAGTFVDPMYTAFAAVAIGDVGIDGWGGYAGGVFKHNSGTGVDNWAYVAGSTYKITGVGSVAFVQNHPSDPGKVIVYNAPEGDEVATYTRGSARLVGGEAKVVLDETFAWTTNPDYGLTVYVTPVGRPAQLYVASKSTREIVVRSAGGSDVDFDYVVYGLRIGFERTSIVQEKEIEAFLPPMTFHEEQYARHPELAGYSADARFRAQAASLGAGVPESAPGAQALEAAIGVFGAAQPRLEARLLTREHQADFEARRARGEIGEAKPVDRRSPDAQRGLLPPPVGREPGPASAPRPESPVPAPGATTASEPWPANATPFRVADSVESGDVVALDPDHPGRLRLAKSTADPGVIGIVAGEPGARWTGQAPIAIAGVAVRCKVDASATPIAAGDLLVASALPGVAVGAGDAPKLGTVIGKALEPLAAGTGIIDVLTVTR